MIRESYRSPVKQTRGGGDEWPACVCENDKLRISLDFCNNAEQTIVVNLDVWDLYDSPTPRIASVLLDRTATKAISPGCVSETVSTASDAPCRFDHRYIARISGLNDQKADFIITGRCTRVIRDI